MKKKLQLFLFFNFLCFAGFGQPYSKITWSVPANPGTNQHLQGVYKSSTGSFMVFTDAEKSVSAFTLVSFTQRGRSNIIHHTLKEPITAVLGAYAKGEELVVLTENIYQREGVFVQDIKSLFFNTRFASEKTLYSFEAKNKTHLGRSRFTVSPDNKRSALFVEAPFSPGSNEEIKLLLNNADGTEEMLGFTLDIESKQNPHNYPRISNQGTIYFLKRDKDRSQQHRYFLYSYIPVSNSLSHKSIAFSNTFIADIRGTLTPEGDFIVGGFTSSVNKHEYEGYFLFKFDPSCSQKFKTQEQFDENTFLRIISKKDYMKHKSIENFFIDHITVTPTGKIFISAEYYREDKKYDYEMGYTYNDVMLVCFNESGEFKTAYKVEKEQHVQNSQVPWASFKTYASNDSLYVMYNNLAGIGGTDTKEPVLQLKKVHEKTGVTDAQGLTGLTETPYFFPDKFNQEDNKHFTAVFTSMDRKNWRVVWVEL